MATSDTGNVIFIHPDGTGVSTWNATRFLNEGPDGRLNWDMMSNSGVYLGHMKDQLTGTSNAGAVTHATGVKVQAGSYGLDEAGNSVVSLSGKTGQTILEEAIAAGKGTAVINSGIIAEPGTGAFLAEVENRSNTQEITRQIVESGVDVILGGGEVDYLPEGVMGQYGMGERTDGLNLIARAQELGYTVVYTREELLNLPEGTQKVLGVFASEDTYNDQTEEELKEAGLPLYNEGTPKVAEMLEATLGILAQNPNGFMIVTEEEGTDNFANNNNAAGTLEAATRADEAIGVAMDFIEQNPNTLLVTAADSEAGGLQVRDPVPADEPVESVEVGTTPPTEVPLDGVNGTGTDPFISAPDSTGRTYPFGIAWAGQPDFPGNVVAKTHGLNADQFPETVDNTGIYRIMYETLFDTTLPSEVVRNIPSGSNGQNTFDLAVGNGTFAIRDFGGVDTGTELSPTTLAEVDTLKFSGAGLTAENLLLTQEDGDLVIGFEGKDVEARLENFALEELDNLPTDASGVVGNILFDEQTEIQDSFDVIDANQNLERVFNQNTVTFLNDLDNKTTGWDDSNDVINGQGGNDTLTGLSGDDILRGGAGKDILTGGDGMDKFWIASGALPEGADTITDFQAGTDVIGIAGLSGVTGIDNLSITQSGADTLISGLNKDLAILTGIQASTLGSENFLFV
jgi:glycerophosphoryl diester phosphodiesterase